MARVSVIIPCYNQEEYIAECLDSVLAQTFQDWEAIVMDDGSQDRSLEIVQDYAQRYPDKIKVIHQENQGVVAARNNAIQQAQGLYIFPLDGDDKIDPTCLEKLCLEADKGRGDVICSQVQLFGLKAGFMDLRKPNKFHMSAKNQVVVSALYKKEDWMKYGGYDVRMQEGLEDWEFWLNFIEDNKLFFRVPEPLVYYRILANSRNRNVPVKKLKKYVYAKHSKLVPWAILAQIWRFCYQIKTTQSNKKIIKIFKIPVYCRKG